MSSPEWNLLETLCVFGDDEPLGFMLGMYQSWIPSASFPRVQHALWMMISTGDVALVRGPDPATATPVPIWEARSILGLNARPPETW